MKKAATTILLGSFLPIAAFAMHMSCATPVQIKTIVLGSKAVNLGAIRTSSRNRTICMVSIGDIAYPSYIIRAAFTLPNAADCDKANAAKLDRIVQIMANSISSVNGNFVVGRKDSCSYSPYGAVTSVFDFGAPSTNYLVAVSTNV